MSGINEKVKQLLIGASAPKAKKLPREFDLVEMPLEGVAAYWLSILKVMATKKSRPFILAEAKHTSEPFVRHLLELCASNLSLEDVRRLAAVKKETMLRDLQRKLVLISIAVQGIASNENPQKVMIRFLSKFPMPPVFERQVFELIQLVLKNLDNEQLDSAKFYNVDHRLKTETLTINLLFYCMFVRRKGREILPDLLDGISSRYFSEGLSLAIDGFDLDFIKYRLNLQEKEIIQETKLKMSMSKEMCLAIKSGIAYDDAYLIAKSFMH